MKAFISTIDEVNSIIHRRAEASIEYDCKGWFYTCTENYSDFSDKECFDILGKELNVDVTNIVVDTAKDIVAIIHKA